MPRYFVARSGQAVEPVNPDNPIMQIIDSFIVGGRHLAETDSVVGLDALGDLQLCSMATARRFDEFLQAQLAFNEVSAQSGRRMLNLSKFYLFAMQLLEQPGDSPGLNDPVYMYGKLFGAFPEAANTQAIEGQLTVTRADILHGIAESEKYGFTYAAGSNHSQLPTRCHHFMVPGDNESETARGAGVVIVYPLPTAEFAANDPSNELAIKQILFDVLQSLKKDLQAQNLTSKFSRINLPVPSRAMLEANLESKGFVIKGSTAVRKVTGTGLAPMDAVLENIFGKLGSGKLGPDRLELPPEGSLDQFIELARLAIQSISGWPPERSKSLARLCRKASADEIARASQFSPAQAAPRPVKTPKASSAQYNQPTSRNAISTASRSRQAPDWMKDFMKAHKTTEAGTLTTTTFQAADFGRDFMSQNQSKSKAQENKSGATQNSKNTNAQNSKNTNTQNSKSANTQNSKSANTQNSKSANTQNSKSANTQNSSWMEDFSNENREIKHNKTKQAENEKAPDWMGDFQ